MITKENKLKGWSCLRCPALVLTKLIGFLSNQSRAKRKPWTAWTWWLSGLVGVSLQSFETIDKEKVIIEVQGHATVYCVVFHILFRRKKQWEWLVSHWNDWISLMELPKKPKQGGMLLLLWIGTDSIFFYGSFLKTTNCQSPIVLTQLVYPGGDRSGSRSRVQRLPAWLFLL